MYKIKTLDNGLRIISESIPYVRSVSIGIWVGTGCRKEDKSNNGISHFIEHMLFKGTENRSAKDIAEAIDSIGGQINAFTGKEYTCYYTKTLDEHMDIAIDILSDMFFHSKFTENDIHTERKVIFEEINMYEDSPEDLVHDVLLETVWAGDPLGYPILGTVESLKAIDRNSILSYMEEYYIPSNTVIAVAGNFDYDKMIGLITDKFQAWDGKDSKFAHYSKPCFYSRTAIKPKDTEQTHICIGFEGIEQGDENIYELLVINNIFGGGMSSRLFQKIREERGLAYSIYSYPSAYSKAGLFTIYSGMNPSQMSEVIKMVLEEVDILVSHKLNEEEVEKSKEQLKGNYILGLESISSRMNSIGKSELLMRKVKTPEEVLDRINQITVESVNDIIDKVFNLNKMSMAAVGVIDEKVDLEKIISNGVYTC